MEVKDIRELYDYNRWADHRTLAAAGKVAGEAFIRPMGNSFSSLRDTLAHILSGEWIWLERWHGRFPTALLDAAGFPNLPTLEARWRAVERDLTQFIQNLTPQLLQQDLSYLNRSGQRFSYPLWQQMVHVVNHSTYHRGQATTLLRQLGAQAAATDFLEYYDEKTTSR